jgi:hypothetical protein
LSDEEGREQKEHCVSLSSSAADEEEVALLLTESKTFRSTDSPPSQQTLQTTIPKVGCSCCV